jgi:hypothetical protein
MLPSGARKCTQAFPLASGLALQQDLGADGPQLVGRGVDVVDQEAGTGPVVKCG